jgi:hypothetical protein
VTHGNSYGKTYNQGTAHGQAKLTDSHVRAMRILYANEFTYRECAELFGITTAHAAGVIQRRSWRHVV